MSAAWRSAADLDVLAAKHSYVSSHAAKELGLDGMVGLELNRDAAACVV